MSFTLVLNSANAYGSQNNTFKYDFIQEIDQQAVQ